MKQQILVSMEQNVVSIHGKSYLTNDYDHCFYILANTCQINKISGRVHYNKKRTRVFLKFSSEYEANGTIFECKLDDQEYSLCELNCVAMCAYLKPSNISDTLILANCMITDLTSIKFSVCTSILSNSAVTNH